MDVEIVRWPRDADRREELHRSGTPRIIVISEDGHPPTPLDDREDWAREPVARVDLEARIAWLNHRLEVRGPPERTAPTIDEDGLLRTDAGWVTVPPVEARLAAALISRLDTVVSRETLTAEAWPKDVPNRNALDVHVLRLRRRITPTGLAIRTVRGRGYLLELATPATRTG
ncbi:MAG: winged helix-turn-helix domain-containing protein [Actinomycetota bacterium]|nr:winged helix-turn-helix domain-containing protein [Actinomycetota bacterium]